jgi:hypothetical protein
MKYADLLKGRPAQFPLSDLCGANSQDACLDLATNPPQMADEISVLACQVAEGIEPLMTFIQALVANLYKIGLVGLKLATFESVTWSSQGRRIVSQAELSPDVRVAVHPAFWRALGVRPRAVEQR